MAVFVHILVYCSARNGLSTTAEEVVKGSITCVLFLPAAGGTAAGAGTTAGLLQVI